MAHDLFISYSSKDKQAADAVCSILESNQIRCWIAPRDITPGVPFAEAIIDGIKDAKVFILIFSSNSNNSQQVIKEVGRAVHHGLIIIPIRLEDIPMSKQLEYYVSDVHWLDALTPPLENHVKKLRRVIQMILTMDSVKDSDIEEALGAGTIKAEKPAQPDKKNYVRRIFIPVAVIILIAVVFGTVRLFKHRADVRWAKEVAIPEISRMIENNDVWRNLVKPYQIAKKAEAILGDDPQLIALLSQVSLHINVHSEPEGAKVYMKEYTNPDTAWTYLGITPMDSVEVPIGIFRWKLEKEGYDTVLAAASTWDVGGEDDPRILGANLVRTLNKADSLPEGMVRIPATETMVGSLGDFFIGRYEVTNREYKEFIDAGGYLNREYWKNPFFKDEQEITWDEAMEEFVDQSGRPGPYTWMGGDFPQGEGDYPISGVSWYEASAYAEWKGMSLPTAAHWNVARGRFTPMIQWPQLGGFAVLAPFTNFGGEGPVAVGSLPGITAYGACDMAGNVREWCWNETEMGRIIRGGSWEDNTYEFGNIRQAPSMDRSPRNGIRLAFYPNPETIPDEAFAMLDFTVPIDINAIQPVPNDIFQVYKEQFSYDPTDLNSRVEYREESPGGWIREKISFDAAYGGERVLAYLFLPDNFSPPYQTVIYFPGSASMWMASSDELESYYEFSMFLSYLIRNGRAVLYPVYKGTFERGEPTRIVIAGGGNNYAYTEFLIQVVKDFRRCIDYLETRSDIDSSKLAFYGMSWGGGLGSIIPAIEERLGASILLAGGINLVGRPEVNGINYVTRVCVPTLMLNGKYDTGIDVVIRPMLDLLGTPPEDKRLILYETDHIPPRTEYIKETLVWLDKYLGPVR